jgi:hypothetical protein
MIEEVYEIGHTTNMLSVGSFQGTKMKHELRFEQN